MTMLAHAPILDVLQAYHWWLLVIALGVTVVATPLARAVAVAGRIYDIPDSGLKPHQKPIPYLGGVAIYAGWAAGLLSAFWLAPIDQFPPESRRILMYVLASGSIMMITGLADDLIDMRPGAKLLCQLIAAGVLVYGGVGRKLLLVFVDWVRALGWGEIELPVWVVLTLSALLSAFIVMGAGNATNLIDGLDGLCSGVTGIIAVGFAVIAGHLAYYAFTRIGSSGLLTEPAAPVRLIVALSLLGACMGFLRYNFNPAQIFMGDAGSLLLGFNAALMLLLLGETRTFRWFIGGCMVFALPVFDTALAITRRWLNGRPILKGDRSHFYDQLRDRGFSVRQTVLICYLLAGAMAATGCMVLLIRTRYAVLVFLAVIAAAIMTVMRMGMLKMDGAQPSSKAAAGKSS